MVRRILVPLDGSTRAEGVLPHVARLASAFGARVDLVHVVPESRPIGRVGVVDPLAYRLARADASRYLEGKATDLRSEGLEVRTSLEEGGAAEVVVDLLRCGSYDLVALTPHGAGYGSHLRMGCTAAAVILNAGTSILIVPDATIALESGGGPSPERRTDVVMAPVDCSPRSDWSVAAAARIARASGSRLALVHVLGVPEIVSRLPASREEAGLAKRLVEANRAEARRYLEQTVWRLERSGVKVEDHLIDTNTSAADALRHVVATERPGLVVLGAHGRGASREWPLGGTAAKLVFWAQRPVLILQDLPVERARPRWSSRLGRAAIHRR